MSADKRTAHQHLTISPTSTSNNRWLEYSNKPTRYKQREEDNLAYQFLSYPRHWRVDILKSLFDGVAAATGGTRAGWKMAVHHERRGMAAARRLVFQAFSGAGWEIAAPLVVGIACTARTVIHFKRYYWTHFFLSFLRLLEFCTCLSKRLSDIAFGNPSRTLAPPDMNVITVCSVER